jgi:polyisoprenoid-binding protein YceI
MFRIVSRLFVAATLLASSSAWATSPFTGKTGKLTVDITGGDTSFTFDGPAAVGPIKGLASGATGQFTIGDAADLATTKGSVKVAVKDMKTGNPTRDQHMQAAEWLDAGKAPHIVFELQGLGGLTVEGNKAKGTATGTLSVRGTTKPVTVPVTVTVNKELTMVKLEAKFTVSRANFGIVGKKMPGMEVGDVITVETTVKGAVK